MDQRECMWCRGHFDDIQGPVHEYIESTPGCWAAYSRLLAEEYADYAALGDIHRLTVDTYAVQHPGRPERKAVQSVWAHLLALRLYLVDRLDGASTRIRLKHFVESKPNLRWLEPPDFTGSLTVSHVPPASNPSDHIRRAGEWGRSVFERWDALYHREIESIATPSPD